VQNLHDQNEAGKQPCFSREVASESFSVDSKRI